VKAFPIFLNVENKAIVVFGGGADAAAKLRLVLKTCASVLVVAEELDADVIQLGDAQWISSPPLEYTFPDNVAFAFAATGSLELDKQLAERARSFGVTVCAADQPAVSDFTTPAIVDRDPVIVAIGTEGTAPVLSRQLKAEIEAQLEPSIGLVARAASKLRPWAAQRFSPGRERRDFWSALFQQVRQLSFVSDSRVAVLANELATANNSKPVGLVQFIAAKHSDPELLTLKARKVLDNADIIIHDSSAPTQILELARREATLLAPTVQTRAGTVLDEALIGNHIVVLSTADHRPDIRALEVHDVAYEVIATLPLAPLSLLSSSSPNLNHKKAA
jgi:uroporphyrin-III C-methyltransferase / precorrin-2 dehydrogenase / sirohydrochlorin ferrochelatase